MPTPKKKYTIKELWDKSWDIPQLLEKYADKFTKEDIKYAMSSPDALVGDYSKLEYLYSFLSKNFDKDLLKMAIDKGDYLTTFFANTKDNPNFDEEIIKYSIDKGKYLGDMFYDHQEKFDKELLKYAIEHIDPGYSGDFSDLFTYFKKLFDKDLIKTAIKKNIRLSLIVDVFGSKFDEDLVRFMYKTRGEDAVMVTSISSTIYDIVQKIPEFKKKYDNRYSEKVESAKYTIKQLVDKSWNLPDVYRGYADKFSKSDIKYAIEHDKEHIDVLYENLGAKFDDELIKFAIDQKNNLEEFYENIAGNLNYDLVKYAFQNDPEHSGNLFEESAEWFDKDLIKTIIKKENKRLPMLYYGIRNKIDEDIIRFAIDNDKNYISSLYRFLADRFTDEDFKYAIDKKANLDALDYYGEQYMSDDVKQYLKQVYSSNIKAEKYTIRQLLENPKVFDKENIIEKYSDKLTPSDIKYIIDNEDKLNVEKLIKKVGYKFSKESVKQLLEQRRHLFAIYEYLGDKFDKDMIKQEILRTPGEQGYLFHYLADKFDEELIDFALEHKLGFMESFITYISPKANERQLKKLIDIIAEEYKYGLESFYKTNYQILSDELLKYLLEKSLSYIDDYGVRNYVIDNILAQQPDLIKEMIDRDINIWYSPNYNLLKVLNKDLIKYAVERGKYLQHIFETAKLMDMFKDENFKKYWEEATGKSYRQWVMPELYSAKYTLRQLLEKGWNIKELFQKYGDKFSKNDIKFIIDTGDRSNIILLYKSLYDKFDTELIKYAIDKDNSYIWELYDRTRDKWNEEILKYFLEKDNQGLSDHLKDIFRIKIEATKYTIKELIDKGWDLEPIFEKYADKFTKDDIRYAINKTQNLEDSGDLYYYLKNKFDKDLIKYAIDNDDKFLNQAFTYLMDKFDKELIKYALNKGDFLYFIFHMFKKKFDEELLRLYEEKTKQKKEQNEADIESAEKKKYTIKELIDKGWNLETLFEKYGDKLTKNHIKYAIEYGKNFGQIGYYLKDIILEDPELRELYNKKWESLYGSENKKYTIKELIDKGWDLEDIFVVYGSRFSKSDIKYAIDKLTDPTKLYEFVGGVYKKFDKELIKYAIDSGKKLYRLYEFLRGQFDQELIDYAIENDELDLHMLPYWMENELFPDQKRKIKRKLDKQRSLKSAEQTSQEAYEEALLKNYSPDFLKEIEQGDQIAEETFGQPATIETTGNLYVKYIETDDAVVILGINSKTGKLERSDVPDLKVWIELLEEKIKEGKTLYTSMNENSKKLIDNIMKRNPSFKYQEAGRIEFPEGEWVNVIITAEEKNKYTLSELIDKSWDLDKIIYKYGDKFQIKHFNQVMDKLAEIDPNDDSREEIRSLYQAFSSKLTDDIAKDIIDRGYMLEEFYAESQDVLSDELIEYGLRNSDLEFFIEEMDYYFDPIFVGKVKRIIKEKLEPEYIEKAKRDAEALADIESANKYTIKQLIEKGWNLETLYEKFGDKIPLKDIKYLIDRGDSLDNLYKHLAHKFDKELIKYAITKGVELSYLYNNINPELVDKELVKYAVDSGNYDSTLLQRFSDKFDKDLIKEVIKDEEYQEIVPEIFGKYFDDDLIKFYIGNVSNLQYLYHYVSDKLDKETIRSLIEAQRGLNYLYTKVAYKFDEELIKLAIDKGKKLDYLFMSIGDKLNKDIVKYAIEKRRYLHPVFKYGWKYLDRELIEYMVDNGYELVYLIMEHPEVVPEDLKQKYYEKNLKRYGAKENKKYTISDLIDKAWEVERLFEKYHSYFKKEDIKRSILAVQGKDDSGDIYYYLQDKFDKELIKFAITHDKQFLHQMYLVLADSGKFDKDIAEYVLENDNEWRNAFYQYTAKKPFWDKDLIQKAMRKEANREESSWLGGVYASFGDRFDKDLIKEALTYGRDIGALLDHTDTNDRSLWGADMIVYAIEHIELPHILISYFGDIWNDYPEVDEAYTKRMGQKSKRLERRVKSDEQKKKYTLKELIDKGWNLEEVFRKYAKKFTPELMKYTYDKFVDDNDIISAYYWYLSPYFTQEVIKHIIESGKDLYELFELELDKNVFDKKLLKYAIEQGTYLYALYKDLGGDFDEELIKLAIDKGKSLDALYKNHPYLFEGDRNLTRYLIEHAYPKDLIYIPRFIKIDDDLQDIINDRLY